MQVSHIVRFSFYVSLLLLERLCHALILILTSNRCVVGDANRWLCYFNYHSTYVRFTMSSHHGMVFGRAKPMHTVMA